MLLYFIFTSKHCVIHMYVVLHAKLVLTVDLDFMTCVISMVKKILSDAM